MPHKQTTNRRISNEQLERLIRKRLAAGLPVGARAIRGMGVAGGSCRVGRIRRHVRTGSVLSPQRRPSLRGQVPDSAPGPTPAHSILKALTAFLRRGRVVQ